MMLDNLNLHLGQGETWKTIRQIVYNDEGKEVLQKIERKEYTIFNLGKKEFKLKGNFMIEIENISKMINPEIKIMEFYESITEYHA